MAGSTVSLPGRTDSDALGLVVGTVPATPLEFSVGLAPGQYAQLDDVVVTRRELPGQAGVQISGVVTNVEATHEGARFASGVFLIQQGALPAEVCQVAEVSVTERDSPQTVETSVVVIMASMAGLLAPVPGRGRLVACPLFLLPGAAVVSGVKGGPQGPSPAGQSHEVKRPVIESTRIA